MRIYLAASFSRKAELKSYADELTAQGHTVTSRWLYGSHDASEDEILTNNELASKFALEDVHDICIADALIAFTEPPRSSRSRGGRHVELGIGIALKKLIAVVGYRENIFCCMSNVEFYANWDELRLDLRTLVGFEEVYRVIMGGIRRLADLNEMEARRYKYCTFGDIAFADCPHFQKHLHELQYPVLTDSEIGRVAASGIEEIL